MSLILEALRKLERERPAPDRGVVVMTAAGLLAERRPVPGWLWLAAGVAAGLGMAVAIVALRRYPDAGPPPPASTALPAASVALPVVPSPSAWPSASPSASARSAGLPASASVPDPRPQLSTPPAPSPSAPALVLQAITLQDGRPVALINDRMLREGDEIAGLRVLRIGDAEVEVEANGVRTILRF